MSLVQIQDLAVEFGEGPDAVKAVDGLSLSIQAGETVCLVGESGCGKSVSALSIARLLPSPPARYTRGRILVDGVDVLRMNEEELRAVRGRVVSYVFQEPGVSLNPVMPAGLQVKEALRLHRRQFATDQEVVRLLRSVGMPAPETRMRDYPHQLSGGLQQRVMIAMALASQPRLLVADEPTTALDVTIQAQIIELFRDLAAQSAMSILMITHHLGIVGQMAGRVAVMYAGQVVESGPASEVLRRPFHPYTRALIRAVPRLDEARERLDAIPGSVPSAGEFPSACRFHPRCGKARAACSVEAPTLEEVEPQHWVRCPYWNEVPTSVAGNTTPRS